MTLSVDLFLHQILTILWRRRYLLVVPVLLLPPIGFLAGAMLPKSYETRMTLLLQEPATLNPFLKDLTVDTHVKERMAGLVQLAGSEHVLTEVLRDVGQIAADTPEDRRTRLVRELSSRLNIQFLGKDLVELRLSGDQPQGMDVMLKAVSDRFIDRLLAPERSSLAGSETFLDGELAREQEKLDAAETELADFRAANADRLPEAFGTNITTLADLRTKLSEKRIELAGAEAEFSDLREKLIGTNPVIGHLEQTIVQLTGELALLRSRYTENHSEVQGVLRKLRRLEEEKQAVLTEAAKLTEADLDRLWNLSAAARSEEGKGLPTLLVSQMERMQSAKARLAGLRREVEQLESSAKKADEMLARGGPVERELKRLERNVQARRTTFDDLTKRLDMARVTGALGRFEAPERIKVIEAPRVPTVPRGPTASLFLLAGIAAGIALGAGLAALAEVLDSTLRGTDSTEKLLGVQVLGRIPQIKPQRLLLASATASSVDHAIPLG